MPHSRGLAYRTRLRPTALRWVVALLVPFVCVALAADRIAVPDLPARPGVPPEVADQLTASLRAALADRGLPVSTAAVVTPGIAGSLEVGFTRLIAELEGTRFAVSGEIVARAGAAGEPFAVHILAVDVAQHRASDLLTRPLALGTVPRVAEELAGLLVDFVRSAPELPAGDAGLFVSSEPRDAEVRVDGVPLGATGRLEVITLAAGRYELEVRKEGYLPEVRVVDLQSGRTSFQHVVLTEVTGGSIRVVSKPVADVYVDGERIGRSPLMVPSLPGVRTVRLERPGFEPSELTVQVRNFWVSRAEAALVPIHPVMLVWDPERTGLVVVDGALYRDGFAEVAVGLVRIELRTAFGTRSFLRAIPGPGVFALDLDTGDVVPIDEADAAGG